jgi:Dna[CI] antecedent, DciA
MDAVGQQAEHSPGIVRILRFSEDPAGRDNDRIGRQDHVAGLPAPGDCRGRFVMSHPKRVRLGGLGSQRNLVDISWSHRKPVAGRGQKLSPSGRGRSQNQAHGNLIVSTFAVRGSRVAVRETPVARHFSGASAIARNVMIPLQNFSSGVLAEIIRRQPASKDRTNFAWQLAVGQALARATTVELKEGVLTVRAVDRRWIREIERALDSVIEKMQQLLGKDQVARIVTRTSQ